MLVIYDFHAHLSGYEQDQTTLAATFFSPTDLNHLTIIFLKISRHVSISQENVSMIDWGIIKRFETGTELEY
jgi:hypothetical protein